MSAFDGVIARHERTAAALRLAEDAAAQQWRDSRFAALQARALVPLRDEDRRFAAALEAAQRSLQAAHQALTS